jgi:hypothetical protein
MKRLLAYLFILLGLGLTFSVNANAYIKAYCVLNEFNENSLMNQKFLKLKVTDIFNGYHLDHKGKKIKNCGNGKKFRKVTIREYDNLRKIFIEKTQIAKAEPSQTQLVKFNEKYICVTWQVSSYLISENKGENLGNRCTEKVYQNENPKLYNKFMQVMLKNSLSSNPKNTIISLKRFNDIKSETQIAKAEPSQTQKVAKKIYCTENRIDEKLYNFKEEYVGKEDHYFYSASIGNVCIQPYIKISSKEYQNKIELFRQKEKKIKNQTKKTAKVIEVCTTSEKIKNNQHVYFKEYESTNSIPVKKTNLIKSELYKCEIFTKFDEQFYNALNEFRKYKHNTPGGWAWDGSIWINRYENLLKWKGIKSKILTQTQIVKVEPGLTLPEEDSLKAQIFGCWNIPLGLPANEDLMVRIKLKLNPDGSVAKTEILDHARMSQPGQRFYKLLAESALRAIKLCQPLRVPSAGYERWKTLTLNFDAREMLDGGFSFDTQIAKTETTVKPKKKVKVAKVEDSTQEEFKPETGDIDNDAPVIEIAEAITVDSQAYKLKGKVKDKSRFQLTIDDRPIKVDKNGQFEFEGFAIDSKEQLKIVAIDRWKNKSEKKVNVEVKIKQVADLRSYEKPNPSKIKVKKDNNKIGIIIGIEKYQNLNNIDAPYANRDAKAFKAYANIALGIPNNNLKVLIDEDATRGELLKSLKIWLPQITRGKEKDIYIFFAGHGLASDNGEDLHILPHNGDPILLEDTALSRVEMFDLINKVSPKSVTMFFDTCYSGQTRSEQMLVAGLRPVRIVANEQDTPNNFTIFTASNYDQTSGSINEAEHGIFSYYLMKGLEGKADENSDKKITNGELISYLKNNVTQEAFSQNRSQEPMLSGDPDKVLISYR